LILNPKCSFVADRVSSSRDWRCRDAGHGYKLTIKSFEYALDSSGAAAAAHGDVEFVVVFRHGFGIYRGREDIGGMVLVTEFPGGVVVGSWKTPEVRERPAEFINPPRRESDRIRDPC
jgi:hypothetical protein